MPTPVSAARQCLTDEAARALDDAVAVARRRCHPQTTSLHAISSLLVLPSSSLRDAIGRARTAVSAAIISPRLQLRALELSVGVSLDRLPSSKASSSNSSSSAASAGDEDGPPVSNSLMAAIKRSQANQRRHPDTFHLIQIHNSSTNPQFNQGTASFLKVELKHFVLSILDDPIVSRVFGEAGFRSPDIKLALLQPPPSSRFLPSARTRCPPVFLCNLDPGRPGSVPGPGSGFGLPFGDENCRRIAEVLTKKSNRNPLLLGVYAKSALRSFVELIEKGRGCALFPPEMASVRVRCFEKEIQEFVCGRLSEEELGLRFEELGREVGNGVVVSLGEVEVLVGDDVGDGAVGFVVSRVARLLEEGGERGKVWVVAVAETANAYNKLVGMFSSLEKDWDLHLLTVTSATPSMEGLYPKSSLMGSFVPFGGFFSTPSEIKSPVSCSNPSFTRCDKCNEKFEEEVADNLKVGSTSLASSYSTSLPWLQKDNVDIHKGLDMAKANEDDTSLNEKILGFQKKWSDICHSLHHARSPPGFDISQSRPQASSLENLRFGSGFNKSSSADPSLSQLQYSSQTVVHSRFPSKQLSPVPVSSDTVSVKTATDHVPNVLETRQTSVRMPWASPSPMTCMNMLDHRSSSPLTPVTTDLGLGTLYTSAAQEPDTPNRRDHKRNLPHLSESLSTDFDTMNDNASHQTARSSSCSCPNLEGKFDLVDFKSLNQLLFEMVGWQDEAISAINRSLFLCKSGAGKSKGSRVRGDVWFAFLGPDRIGKKKIASVLAEIIFGNKESLISVDLNSHDRFYPLNSIFECQKSYCHDVLRRKTIVDYIAGELSKRPHSVVFLENVDKADYMVQTSLSQAIRTGKFPDSHGREIGINNAIFIVTSTVCKGNSLSDLEEPKMFSEERILEARRCQMQLILGQISEDAAKSASTNVKVVLRKGFSKPSFISKRKQGDGSDSKEGGTCKMQKQDKEASRSFLDLNMPLEEIEEGNNDNDRKCEPAAENTEACSSDLCNQIDEKVVFKPFNFEALADQLLKCISTQFQRTFGSEFQLEIDYEVMKQILAAAWLSEKKNAVEHWVENVLGRGFVDAMQKYHPASLHVMKLVNSESNFVEEHAPGVCLPARINLN